MPSPQHPETASLRFRALAPGLGLTLIPTPHPSVSALETGPASSAPLPMVRSPHSRTFRPAYKIALVLAIDASIIALSLIGNIVGLSPIFSIPGYQLTQLIGFEAQTLTLLLGTTQIVGGIAGVALLYVMMFRWFCKATPAQWLLHRQ